MSCNCKPDTAIPGSGNLAQVGYNHGMQGCGCCCCCRCRCHPPGGWYYQPYYQPYNPWNHPHYNAPVYTATSVGVGPIGVGGTLNVNTQIQSVYNSDLPANDPKYSSTGLQS